VINNRTRIVKKEFIVMPETGSSGPGFFTMKKKDQHEERLLKKYGYIRISQQA